MSFTANIGRTKANASAEASSEASHIRTRRPAGLLNVSSVSMYDLFVGAGGIYCGAANGIYPLAS